MKKRLRYKIVFKVSPMASSQGETSKIEAILIDGASAEIIAKTEGLLKL
jgi:hypothetical protein